MIFVFVSYLGLVVPLHLAVANEDQSMVETLLSCGCHTEDRDVDGDTPLIAACHAGLADIVSNMIAARADVNATGYNGNTSLHHAVSEDYISIVQQLLSADVDTTVENNDSYTAAMLAVESGHVECLHLLLLYDSTCTGKTRTGQTVLHLAALNGAAQMVDIILEFNEHLLDAVDSMGNSSLVTAAKLGHEQFVVELLKHNPNCALVGEQERNVLHWTAERGLTQSILSACELLVVNSEDFKDVVDSQDCLGNTSVILAAQNKNEGCLEGLLQAGCNTKIRGEFGRNLLHWVAIHGCTRQTLELVLASGVDINAKDDEYNTALVLAAANRNYEVIGTTLDKYPDCDVNVKGSEGKTVLHWLALRGNLTMLLRLLNVNSCDMNQRDEDGKTALLICAENKRVQCFTELIDRGADVNLSDSSRVTPLHYMAEAGLQYCVDQALRAGAHMDTREEAGGSTALTQAARGGHVKVMRMLLDAQCDVTLAEEDGKTALWYAAQQGLVDMVRSFFVSFGTRSFVTARQKDNLSKLPCSSPGPFLQCHLSGQRFLCNLKAILSGE